MRPDPITPPPSSVQRGGCCGCVIFPAILALFGGSAFWFCGFTTGLVLHALAALVWAGTQAVGHALFGWRLPPLRSPRSSRREEE